MKNDIKVLICAMVLVALCGIIVQLTIENFQLKALRRNQEIANQVRVNSDNIRNMVGFINKMNQQPQPTEQVEQE